MKTKLIGHRGAAGLALENSPASLKAALKASVDAVEFDVRRTRDGQLVVLHDKDTARVSAKIVNIGDVTLDELREVQLNNGQPIITLNKALDIVGSKPVIVEIKDGHSADELLHIVHDHPAARVSVASFNHSELRRIREVRPDIALYVLEHFSPFEIIQSARGLQAKGIGLNKWLMNPLTYYLAKQHHLELYVYTVNNRWLGQFFTLFYPTVHICTDFPSRFIKPAL